MILMPQIFDVTANENARYKRNELELYMYLDPEISSAVKSIPVKKIRIKPVTN